MAPPRPADVPRELAQACASLCKLVHACSFVHHSVHHATVTHPPATPKKLQKYTININRRETLPAPFTRRACLRVFRCLGAVLRPDVSPTTSVPLCLCPVPADACCLAAYDPAFALEGTLPTLLAEASAGVSTVMSVRRPRRTREAGPARLAGLAGPPEHMCNPGLTRRGLPGPVKEFPG